MNEHNSTLCLASLRQSRVHTHPLFKAGSAVSPLPARWLWVYNCKLNLRLQQPMPARVQSNQYILTEKSEKSRERECIQQNSQPAFYPAIPIRIETCLNRSASIFGTISRPALDFTVEGVFLPSVCRSKELPQGCKTSQLQPAKRRPKATSSNLQQQNQSVRCFSQPFLNRNCSDSAPDEAESSLTSRDRGARRPCQRQAAAFLALAQ